MELHQLRYAVRIAETLNFTRAAADLAVAQPSLSQQIRKLERELGFGLFHRGPGGVTLTPEGDLFLPHARAILERVREAVSAAEEIRGVQRGLVTIGISPIAGAHVLPRLLRATRDGLPGVRVETREAGLSRLLELLDAGAIDLALVLLPNEDPRLDCLPLLSEDLVVALPFGHRLAGAERLDLADLRAEPLILLTGEYGLRRQIEAECARAGFHPAVIHESGEVGIIQSLVEAGLGLTLLPASALRPDPRIVVRPVTAAGRSPRRRIGLARRQDRYLSLAARRVFDLARHLGDPDHSGEVLHYHPDSTTARHA